MPKTFDPYHRWLGIPPRHQPPNHYRLLGIEPFEDAPEVIETAADQRMMLLRTFQAGEHADDSQRLLNEVSAAKVCLLSAARKAEYDATLRAETVADVAEATEERPPAPPVLPRESGVLEALPPLPPEPSPHEAPSIPRGGPPPLAPLWLPRTAASQPKPLWQRTPFLLAVGLGGLGGTVLLVVVLAQWSGGDGRSDDGSPVDPARPPIVRGDGVDGADPPPIDPRQEPIRRARPGELAFHPDQLLALYTFVVHL